MNKLFVGEIGLSVIGEGNFNLETLIGGKFIALKPDGSTVEFDVFEVLHNNLKAIDEETGIEIFDETAV
jgi:hypothetical protein